MTSRFYKIVFFALLTSAHSVAAQSDNRLHVNLKIVSHRIHDQSDGKTRIEIIKSDSVIDKSEFNGIWYLLNYSNERAFYVFGGTFQIGAWIVMTQ
jgi:hypothetical protein